MLLYVSTVRPSIMRMMINPGSFVLQVLLYGRGYWKTSSQIKRKLEETDVVLQKDAQSTMEGGM